MNLNDLWPKMRETANQCSEREAPRLRATLAFYIILSLAPLVIAIVALAFGRTATQHQILGQVQGMIGQDGADAVKTVIEHAQKPASGA